jgi:hypothetical protein
LRGKRRPVWWRSAASRFCAQRPFALPRLRDYLKLTHYRRERQTISALAQSA